MKREMGRLIARKRPKQVPCKSQVKSVVSSIFRLYSSVACPAEQGTVKGWRRERKSLEGYTLSNPVDASETRMCGGLSL